MTIINRSFSQKIIAPFIFGVSLSAPTRDSAAQNLGRIPPGFFAGKVSTLTKIIPDFLDAGYRIVSGGLGMRWQSSFCKSTINPFFCAVQFPGSGMMGGMNIGASQCFSFN